MLINKFMRIIGIMGSMGNIGSITPLLPITPKTCRDTNFEIPKHNTATADDGKARSAGILPGENFPDPNAAIVLLLVSACRAQRGFAGVTISRR
jgi:hypothetical protein